MREWSWFNGENRDVNSWGKRASQPREQFDDAVDDGNDIGARLALDVHDHRGLVVLPRRQKRVLDVIHDLRHVGEMHRGPVAVGDHQRTEVLAREQLIVAR